MLQVPRLDDLDYETIFGRARGRISQYTEEWTDLNHHDPGVTVIQTMAWLADTLNYYADATGEEHRLRYLKLLGIEPEAKPASCVLALRGDGLEIDLPPGTRVAAEEVVFELRDGYRGAANRLKCVYHEVDGAFTDLAPFLDGGGAAQLFVHDPSREAAVYLGFARALTGGVELYVDIADRHGRNPLPPGKAPELAELAWEYYDGAGWQSAALREDETGGLLASGFVRLALPGETKRFEDHPLLPAAHYLRARLVRNDYDLLPELGGVEVNCAPAEQVRTLCRTLELTYAGGERLPVDHIVRDTDRLMVSVARGEGFEVWYRFAEEAGSLCTVARGETPWLREVVFDKKKGLPAPGSRVLVTILDGDSLEKLMLGKTTGCAGQRLPVDLEGVRTLRLALFDPVEGGAPRFQIWEPCADVAAAGCSERVFSFDDRVGAAVFGDALHGLQPRGGKLVMALDAVVSLFGEGNARRGRINRVVDAIGGVAVENITDAAGGVSRRDSRALEIQIAGKLENRLRAVTPEDYIRLTGETPGLLIDRVAVVSGREYDRAYGADSGANTVYVAVKPVSLHEARPGLKEAYRRLIRDHLEQYRLLTTDIRVIPARYVGIAVNGRLILRENADWARRQVEQMLREMIDFRKTRRFGGQVVYGKVYSRLEMLEGVASVAELTLSYEGACCEKNDQGDVVVYADALAWLQEINIEFQ